jgi:hypothetical protein
MYHRREGERKVRSMRGIRKREGGRERARDRGKERERERGGGTCSQGEKGANDLRITVGRDREVLSCTSYM